MPAAKQALGLSIEGSGGWMSTLLDSLKGEQGVQIAVVCCYGKQKIEGLSKDGIEYYVIPSGRREPSSNPKSLLLGCCDVIRRVDPDVIHIHGTERFYGLLSSRRMVSCPVVISLQGLLGPYSEWYHYFGSRSLLEIIRMHRFLEFPALRGQWIGFWNIQKAAKREQEIIRGNRYFIGRTAWDQAYVKAINPNAEYYYGGELLRKPFWQKQWHLGNVTRHRIIFTNAGHPRKGTETLLEAVALLKLEFPDIQVCIAGGHSRRSGYGRYIRKHIMQLGESAVELGPLNAEQLSEALEKSHVFVSPSFIDNSPNAVCEAQLIGMPVVSTYTGGLPSLIEEGHTGLFFPTGDVPMLASRLREVFLTDTLATELGKNSRDVAQKRHNPDTIVADLVQVYENVIKNACVSTNN
jgi:glycosyltransferase involved in cell wall biosynthesis